MKKIRIKKDTPIDEFHFTDDCIRLQKIFATHDLEISLDDARDLYEEYSDSYCAGWLMMGKDDNLLFDNLKDYYEIIDNDCKECDGSGYSEDENICDYCDAACSCKDNPNVCLVHIGVEESR
jgi:hypothetical protein